MTNTTPVSTGNLPDCLRHIDDHPAVSALLERERGIEADILRCDVEPYGVAAESAATAADRYLAEGVVELRTPEELNRQRQAKKVVLREALLRVREQLIQTRAMAQKEIIDAHRIAEKAAASRAEIFRLGLSLLQSMKTASWITDELIFNGIHASHAKVWMGGRKGIEISLAVLILDLHDLEAGVLTPEERERLEIEVGRRTEAPLINPPMPLQMSNFARHAACDNSAILE